MKLFTPLFGISVVLLFSTDIVLARPSRLAERVAKRARKSNPLNHVDIADVLLESFDTIESITNADHNTSFSSNWAGAVLTSAPQGQKFTNVVGTFTVPDPSQSNSGSASNNSNGASASTWVGIDGDTETAAILQAGIDFTTTADGSTTYNAWYEYFPNPASDFPDGALPISAGDSITVTIETTSSTSGTVTLENNTQKKSVSQTLNAPSSTATITGQNAEWIVEDFDVNGSLVNFVNFGQVPFSDCSATTDNSQQVGLDNANIINIVGSDGTALTQVSIEGSSEVTVQHL